MNKKPPIIYLDNAATSFPKPEGIIEKAAEFVKTFGVNPGRSSFEIAQVAHEMITRTRKKLTSLFGGTEPSRLIFCNNATDAFNIVLRGLLENNDHVVTTPLEHNSVIRPLNHLKDELNLALAFISLDNECRIDPKELPSLLHEKTKAVIVNHASNVTGSIQPVREIGQICKDRGIVFIVDAAQSAGHIDLQIENMNIDVLVWTGHKGLLGPMGTGGFYLGNSVELRPVRTGGTGINSADPYQPDGFPVRMEAGTPNLFGIACLNYGLDYILESGLEKLSVKEKELFNYLHNALAEIPEITLHGPQTTDKRTPVLNFTVNGMTSAKVGEFLDIEYNIASRTGLHCAPLLHNHLGTEIEGTVRLSIGVMNTMQEIESATNAIAKIVKDFSRK